MRLTISHVCRRLGSAGKKRDAAYSSNVDARLLRVRRGARSECQLPKIRLARCHILLSLMPLVPLTWPCKGEEMDAAVVSREERERDGEKQRAAADKEQTVDVDLTRYTICAPSSRTTPPRDDHPTKSTNPLLCPSAQDVSRQQMHTLSNHCSTRPRARSDIQLYGARPKKYVCKRSEVGGDRGCGCGGWDLMCLYTTTPVGKETGI